MEDKKPIEFHLTRPPLTKAQLALEAAELIAICLMMAFAVVEFVFGDVNKAIFYLALCIFIKIKPNGFAN